MVEPYVAHSPRDSNAAVLVFVKTLAKYELLVLIGNQAL